MDARDQEWNQLFRELSDNLAPLGNGDVLDADADYFLVDDDWGGQHQKLCVLSKQFWSREVEEVIRATLQRHYPQWGVIVVFEKGSRCEGSSLVLYADGVTTKKRFD